MVSVVAFLAELLGSVGRLILIFLLDVALSGPLSFLAFVMGALLVTVSLGVFGYLVLGAVVDLFGGTMWSPGRTPPRRG
jgi:hypothetical protein